MGLTKASLNKIKKHLPRPWVDTLANEFEISDSMVVKVMAGSRVKKDLVVKAIEMSKLPAAEKEQYTYKVLND
ncbi:hypothetical protein ACFSJU_14975 [Paradesertivirga mongoliensis]|uniref:Uncharacterized protein n=1 Tax=Paradesertivirga mongoliensis TaxID=2100740 RepID=A0ABW4ZQ59_9SPHI|nr:hypothetical protein [Pedobacter mongoliensis]